MFNINFKFENVDLLCTMFPGASTSILDQLPSFAMRNKRTPIILVTDDIISAMHLSAGLVFLVGSDGPDEEHLVRPDHAYLTRCTAATFHEKLKTALFELEAKAPAHASRIEP